jgi:hypothetical protein
VTGLGARGKEAVDPDVGHRTPYERDREGDRRYRSEGREICFLGLSGE